MLWKYASPVNRDKFCFRGFSISSASRYLCLIRGMRQLSNNMKSRYPRDDLVSKQKYLWYPPFPRDDWTPERKRKSNLMLSKSHKSTLVSNFICSNLPSFRKHIVRGQKSEGFTGCIDEWGFRNNSELKLRLQRSSLRQHSKFYRGAYLQLYLHGLK